MLELGLPVPEGFVVTDEAFQSFLAQEGLGERLARLREGLVPGALEAIRHASRQMQELVRQTPLPESVRTELARWRERELADQELIVRSSAVGEDSSAASFAGQLDSIIGVRTPQELERALVDCWASYWSERSVAYQLARGVALSGMGVVVQRLVHPRLAGVLFTQGPQLARGMMLVEYCHGHGEALVSGRVDPGRFTLSRADGVWNRLSQPEHVVPEDEGLLFRSAAMEALRSGGMLLEERLGGPQDVEWVVDERGRVLFVQSRPITAPLEAGPAAPVLPEPPRRPILWSNANINENFPDAVTPLLYSVAAEGYYHYFRNLALALGMAPERVERMEQPLRQLIGVHGARMYYNLTHIHDFLRSAPFGERLSGYFDRFIGASFQDGAEASDAGARPGAGLTEALEVARIFLSTTRVYSELGEHIRQFEQRVDAFSARTHPRLLRERDLLGLREDLRGFLEIRFHRWVQASLADAAAMVCFGVLEQVLEAAMPEPEERALHGTLLKGLSGLVSAAPIERLWELSRQVRGDRRLRELFERERGEALLEQVRGGSFPDFHQAFERYLEEWGFRGSGELMLTVPNFQEEPAGLLEMLRGYVTLEGPSPAELLRQQGAEREAATARVLARLKERVLVPGVPRALQARLFPRLLEWTQQAIAFRERARLKQALLYTRLRAIALAIGQRLVEQGRVERREDALFLTWQELESLLGGGAMFPQGVAELVALRRRQHEVLSQQHPPDRMVLPEGVYWAPESQATASEPAVVGHGALKGVGTCGGRVSAPAAVIQDLAEAHRLAPGDILVTRQTDPGWAPVFFLIKGLIMERGGMLSHGSIIARELGIPAVVGVKDATQRIRHGQVVVLDGDLGDVRLVE
jgi:pyruvate,water dikinase